MRAVNFAVLGGLLLSLCSACADANTERQSAVLLVLKARDNPFFQEIERGTRSALEQRFPGARLIVRAGATESDVTSQRRVLDEFFQQYAADDTVPRLLGLVLTPSGSADELTRSIKMYKDQGIPVLIVDTRIDDEALRRAGTTYDAFVGSDNRWGGALAAQLIGSLLPDGGQVLLLNGVQGHETAEARRAGFRESLDSLSQAGRNFVLVERTANWRRNEARSTVDALSSLGRRFDAVFAANDEMALGALEALRQSTAGAAGTVVVGFDAIDEARRAVQEGRLTATIEQQPFEMGRLSVETLYALRDSSAVARDVVIPVQIVRR